jgi:hypothetical protein
MERRFSEATVTNADRKLIIALFGSGGTGTLIVGAILYSYAGRPDTVPTSSPTGATSPPTGVSTAGLATQTCQVPVPETRTVEPPTGHNTGALRTSADIKAQKLEELNRGTFITVMSAARGTDEQCWYKVRVNGSERVGWIHSVNVPEGTDAARPVLPPEDEGFVDLRGGWGWGDKCWVHIQAGKWSWAKAECDKGMAMNPASPQPRASLLYNEGLIAKAAGRVAEARRSFVESLALREHPEVRAALDSLPPE